VPDLGTAAAGGLDGRPARVGQVLQTPDGTAYLLAADGLVPLTPVRERLQLADPRTAVAYPDGRTEPIPLSQAAAAQTRRSDLVPGPGLPAVPPALVDPNATAMKICVSVSDPTGPATISVVPTSPPAAPATGVPTDVTGAPVADAIDLTPGQGALVRAVAGADLSVGTIYLISDLGVKFPVASSAELTDLGFGGTTPTPAAVALVQLFPTGATLDEKAAAASAPPH
jgi:hypothetical protein